MGSPVVSFDIVGKDSKTLGDFYRSVFDWKWTEYAEGYYGFETGSESDNGIKGLMYPPNDEIPLVDGVPFANNVTIYVAVEDIHATVEKLESLDGTILMPPTVVSDKGELLAMFLDPNGNRIGLYQSKE